jgi:hypothetical protein
MRFDACRAVVDPLWYLTGKTARLRRKQAFKDSTRMSEGLRLAAAHAIAVATLELGVSLVGRRPPPARDSRRSLPLRSQRW